MDIIDGVEWLQIYWMRGPDKYGTKHRNVVRDPSHSGWSLAIVLRGDKRSTIFCVASLRAFDVPNTAGELAGAKEPRDPMSKDRLIKMIQDKWKKCQSFGFARDYDVAALILRKLGGEVPAQILKGGEEDTRTKGGKDTASKLIKPVKRSSKRGKFLEWFLEADGSCSIREVMAEFGMTRSNALSYLYMLQKDHGIGYVLVGDIATVSLPDKCENPFDNGPPPKVDDDDDSWLD